MKVLFLLSIGFDKPGPSVHLLTEIMERCIDSEIEVVAIFRGEKKENQGIPSKLLDSPLFSYNMVEYPSIDKNNFVNRYLSEVKYAYKCKKEYKKYKDIDSVFLQSNTVAFFHCRGIKRVLKCPVLFNVQDIFPLNLKELNQMGEKNLIYKFLRYLQSKAYVIADKVITISPDMKEALSGECVDKEKIDYIFNWSYSNNPISVEENENRFVINNAVQSGYFNVVYAGNLGRMQNVDIVVDAAKMLKDDDTVRFYIVGDGIYKDRLIEHSKGLNNVTFLPMQPPEYAGEIYRFADVNVIPLVAGGIKTALPSKTATCLRANKPIVFSIGKNCKFAKLVSETEKITVCDSNDAVSLVRSITAYKNDNLRVTKEPYDIFCKYFMTDNANRYVEYLTQLATKTE